jgi:hypothetical protein
MTEENTTLNENEESTLDENAESEDSSLEDIFNDDSEESQDESDADKVKRLEEKIARIEKGVKKLATDKGNQAKEEERQPVKKEIKDSPSINDEVVEELLLTKHPEAEHILDELKDVAKQTGKSVLKLYRESKYFQGEAKALADVKKSEEEAKSKIKTPSSGALPPKTDISSTKPEDVDKLKPEDKLKWISLQAEKERNSSE